MCPRRSCEEKRHFDPSVGCLSGGLDNSMSPPIAINLDHYNSVDGRSRLRSI